MYASTPPLEAMRVVLGEAATTDNNEHGKNSMKRGVTVNRVSRAYFYAQSPRALFMILPREDEEAK